MKPGRWMILVFFSDSARILNVSASVTSCEMTTTSKLDRLRIEGAFSGVARVTSSPRFRAPLV